MLSIQFSIVLSQGEQLKGARELARASLGNFLKFAG